MSQYNISGIIPAVVMAYDDEGKVSTERLAVLYDFLIKSGVNGLFIGGSTGEWLLLTSDERKLATQVALDTAKGRVPVIMHISSMLPHEVADYAAWAKKAGVAAVSLLVPYYYSYDDEGLKRYFDIVLPQIELPVYIYNIPGNVKNNMSVSLLNTLAQEYDMVIGVKDSSMDFMKVEEYSHGIDKEDFAVFTGNDAQILPCLMWGGTGGISAVAGAFPETVCKMYDCFLNGNLTQAKQIQERLMDYRRFVVSNPALSVVKAALELRGIPVGSPRAPLHALSAERLEELKNVIKKAELMQ